jgi:DNA repair protein RadC
MTTLPASDAWTFARVVREPGARLRKSVKILKPKDVVSLLASRATQEDVEVFYVVALDAKLGVKAVFELTRGLMACSLVHPREVFRAAIGAGAYSIIVAHNHPSGDPTPSEQDFEVTRQLVYAGALLDIEVADHVIIGDRKRYYSFSESGRIRHMINALNHVSGVIDIDEEKK